MRPHGSPRQLERRRRKALTLWRQGRTRKQIAHQLNATPQAVGQWIRAYEQGGDAALTAKPVPGRPAKLSARQCQALVRCLLKGATVFGYDTDLWTSRRVARLIADRYGVRYHVDHMPHLLASLGFSPAEAGVSCAGGG